MATSDSRRLSTLPRRISKAVKRIEPTAEVLLYGSRARGDAGPESDWDILVLLDGEVGRSRESAVVRRLYDLSVETDAVLVAIVHSKQEWDSALYKAMPFRQNVSREGIRL